MFNSEPVMRFGEYVEEEVDGAIVIDYIRSVKH